LDGIDALLLDDQSLSFASEGLADYNELASDVRAAATANRKYLCTIDRTAAPHLMTCLLPIQLSAAELARREPLRRLDGNGMPLGSIRMAGMRGSNKGE
jgi:hypothetical protein